MNMHKNARLTPLGRERMVKEMLSGQTPELGEWNTVFKRFDYWSKAGVFRKIFEAVSDDPDMEYAMIDATIVPVHRHGHGAKV